MDNLADNVVKIISGAHVYWILIDLDASCNLGAPAGQKVTSSAFFPPEMARRELDKLKNKLEREPEPVVASKQFEMWYFGLMVLQVIASISKQNSHVSCVATYTNTTSFVLCLPRHHAAKHGRCAYLVAVNTG